MGSEACFSRAPLSRQFTRLPPRLRPTPKLQVTSFLNGGVRGGDGFVFWYVQEPRKEGDMFGSSDDFKGLAVIFDSWDDDAVEDNPFISVLCMSSSIAQQCAQYCSPVL